MLKLKFYFRIERTHTYKEDIRSAEKEVIHNHDIENVTTVLQGGIKGERVTKVNDPILFLCKA